MFCKHTEEGKSHCGRTDATLCDIYSKGFPGFISEWLCMFHQDQMRLDDECISIYPHGLSQVDMQWDEEKTA